MLWAKGGQVWEVILVFSDVHVVMDDCDVEELLDFFLDILRRWNGFDCPMSFRICGLAKICWESLTMRGTS